MVNVEDIGEMGAYVTLLEYDNIEVHFFLGYLCSVSDDSDWIGHDFVVRTFSKTNQIN